MLPVLLFFFVGFCVFLCFLGSNTRDAHSFSEPQSRRKAQEIVSRHECFRWTGLHGRPCVFLFFAGFLLPRAGETACTGSSVFSFRHLHRSPGGRGLGAHGASWREGDCGTQGNKRSKKESGRDGVEVGSRMSA